jgi:hypothetical protein
MSIAAFQPWSNTRGAPALRRMGILLLVAALHVLLMIMLLRLAPPPPLAMRAPAVLTTVALMPEPRVAAVRIRAAQSRRAKARTTVPVPPQAAPPVATSAGIWAQVIPITREQFAASDIAAMPSRPAARNDSDTDGSETAIARDSGDTPAAGEGPNGELLYDAEWYRRPTRAELGFYLASAAPQTGWGMIVCQTVTDYRVDNCREIGQSPEGSGLARAVRQAAWQFRVLPPRKGGRPMIGAWVRIRIDYTVNG